ncbi:zinc finger BED domain-containing protein RICESLEEPER 2-like [Cornus florida]|uniref:zinc finger BED domain-containing protein RICESLEEPER 2-like n=1 Tax=Cornus florida TaxID=4283 RepID=UPI00289F9FBA|nr:zinc finger BED domain-containing protein RICESLEEPER 2-like [Cornus florida]
MSNENPDFSLNSSTSDSESLEMDSKNENAKRPIDEVNEVIDVEVSKESPFQTKKRKKTSHVWNDFEIVTEPDGSKKAKCKFCKTKLATKVGGPTTHLIRHLNSCPRRLLVDKKQNILSVGKGGLGSEPNIANFKYDHAKVREAAAHMILVHEYSFNMMEHEFFNRFMNTATPHYQKISRTTAKNDCVAVYEMEKKRLKTTFKSVNKVSITSDFWKSGQQIGYMCLTGHFIDSEWKLQKRILNFCDVPPPHTGVVKADTIFQCLIDWGIENKVSTVTFDNASNNDAAIRILRDNFTIKSKLFFGGKIFHVRCCAHILNLMVQDGLSEIQNVIENVRESVKYLKASEARLLKFSEIVKQLQLPSRKLILDVPTRWNATYAMLEAAIKFKEVFPRYQDRDPSYRWLPSLEDWSRIEEVCQFLKVFQVVTNTISGSVYPTSNMFLPEVWKIKEALSENSLDENIYMRSMANKMKEKFDKYWGECNLLMAIGAILDPRYKMVLIKFCFPKIYSELEASKNIDIVRKALYDLFKEYVETYTSTNLEQEVNVTVAAIDCESSHTSKFKSKGRLEFDLFVRKNECVQPSKSELDMYLEEGVFICHGEMDHSFDAIEWWKVNNLKFRILSKMAVDILSIPITTVASEAAFSTGGRTIDPYRASLSTKTVEALICAGDWVGAFWCFDFGKEKTCCCMIHFGQSLRWKLFLLFGAFWCFDFGKEKTCCYMIHFGQSLRWKLFLLVGAFWSLPHIPKIYLLKNPFLQVTKECLQKGIAVCKDGALFRKIRKKISFEMKVQCLTSYMVAIKDADFSNVYAVFCCLPHGTAQLSYCFIRCIQSIEDQVDHFAEKANIEIK